MLCHKTAVCLSSAESLGGQGRDRVVTAFQLLPGTQERSLRFISREWGSGVTLKLSLVWLLPNPHFPVLKFFLPACPAGTVCKDNTSEPGQPVLRPGMQKTWDERLAQPVQGTKPCVFCRASHKSPACSPSKGLCACEQAGVEGLSTLLPQCLYVEQVTDEHTGSCATVFIKQWGWGVEDTGHRTRDTGLPGKHNCHLQCMFV